MTLKLDVPVLNGSMVRLEPLAVAHAYSDPRSWPGRDDLCAIEIGWSWLAASAQRTGINIESKLLLFAYAFETLRLRAVPFARRDRRLASSRNQRKWRSSSFAYRWPSSSPCLAIHSETDVSPTGAAGESARPSIIASSSSRLRRTS